MSKRALPLLFLALSMPMFAQTPTFTQSKPQTCQLATTNCFGMLDQSGSWRFNLANNTLGISNPSFTVHGSLKVTAGAAGEIQFDWTAIDANGQQHNGYATVQTHYIRICGRYCWPTLVVDSAEIFVQE